MAEKRAEDIINLHGKLESDSTNFRNLQQEVADYYIPRESNITTLKTPGEDKSIDIFDPTPMLDLEDMVSGISSAFFPPGQIAFGIKTQNRAVENLDRVKRYLSLASQITHDELYASNFMLQLNETLTSIIGFGTGTMFSEFLIKPGMPLGLNFRDWDIALYQYLENAHRLVDSMFLKFPLTALQAVEEFGNKAGKDAIDAANDVKKCQQIFHYIHAVRPRKNRNINFTDFENMPFESLFVNVKDKVIIDEGGFTQFPFAAARWTLSSNERWGRGQGTKGLSVAKSLQQQWGDLKECGNKWVNPPREVLDNFEGKVRVKPGATNFVKQIPSIKALEQGMMGNFPIGKESLTMTQDIVHRLFFRDVFAPLADLTGDRRTTLEIRERIKSAMKKLALPIYRLETELFTPTITRCIMLLIQNFRIPPPPPELQGTRFTIEYTGELALAMRDQQAAAFQQFALLLAEFEETFPGSTDIVSPDRALPDIGMAFGVKAEHMATPDEIAAKRERRARDAQLERELLAIQAGGKAYKDASGKAEEGSPAAMAQEALTGATG